MSDKLSKILKSIDPKITLTKDAEKLIIMMTNDFITDVTDGACMVADSRNSSEVEVSDLAIYLKKNWDMDVEGYSIATTNPEVSNIVKL